MTGSAPSAPLRDAREFSRLANITRLLWRDFDYHVHVEPSAMRVAIAPDLQPGFCDMCGVRYSEHPTNWCNAHPVGGAS